LNFFDLISGLFKSPQKPVQPVKRSDGIPVLLAVDKPALPSQYKPSAALIACVGAACATILVQTIPSYEGVKNVGYYDPVGIPTKCMGDTTDVVIGQIYSVADCTASLNNQLILHANPVLACVPDIADRPKILAASVSLAYNIGSNGFCKSLPAKDFNTGKFLQGCEAFKLYDTAAGKVLPGLVTRRQDEATMCETGLK
jgi:lysozyme